MGVDFQVFSMQDQVERLVREEGFLGIGTRTVVKMVPKYKTTRELYRQVAETCDLLGDRLIAVTGTPLAQSSNICSGGDIYQGGEVVVWYRHNN